jgi:tetratricopeptide (TPR) repeat protein
MDMAERRRERLARLLDLAQTYRGWTRKELARALRRDPTKLIPGSGIPKLDLVIDLAGVLDWSVEDVVTLFWEQPDEEGRTTAESPADFDAIDATMRDAHAEGRYGLLVTLAERAFEVAETAEQRALACNREAGGWDGLGRYQNAMKAIHRGLREAPVSGELRRVLQSNLANAYYSIWSLVEAKAIAGDLVHRFDAVPAESRRDRWTAAFSRYVLGHTHRRLLGTEPDDVEVNGALARRHLESAITAYRDLAEAEGNRTLLGIARTCEGGLIEVDVALGAVAPHEALARIHARIEDADGAEDRPAGDELESVGWWCIFGCNIALRSVEEERELQKHMAVFTNKADEIANRLDSWAIRERVFTMEHARWERAVGCTGFEIPCVVDEEDVRVITGTMARYPTFRDTGWRILNSAKVVGRD